MRRFDIVTRHAFQRGQHHHEDKGDPLPAIADDDEKPCGPGIRRPCEIAKPGPLPDGREGALGGICHHAKGVAHADGRDHQRNEEHHAKEGAAPDRQRAQKGKAQPDAELQATAAQRIEQRGAQRAKQVAGKEGGGQKPADAKDQAPCKQAAHEADHGKAACHIADDPPYDQRRNGKRHHPAQHRHALERAQKMELLGAEKLLFEILKPDKAHRIRAAAQPDPAHCHDKRGHQRKNRENKDHRNGGPDEYLRRMPIQPVCQPLAAASGGNGPGFPGPQSVV